VKAFRTGVGAGRPFRKILNPPFFHRFPIVAFSIGWILAEPIKAIVAHEEMTRPASPEIVRIFEIDSPASINDFSIVGTHPAMVGFHWLCRPIGDFGFHFLWLIATAKSLSFAVRIFFQPSLKN